MGEKVKIVGIGPYSFTDSNGRQIEGYSFHVLTTPNVPGFEGQTAAKLSVSKAVYAGWEDSHAYIPKVGHECFVFYNRYGKCAGFQPLK